MTAEILVSAAAAGALWLLSSSLHLGERLISFVQVNERFQADEILVLLILLVLWFAFLARRRSRELLAESSRRQKAEYATFLAARHDSLTGLPNRRLFMELLNASLAAGRTSGKRCAVLFIDLDGFKAINDEHGHSTGDLLLMEVAERLRELAGEGRKLARLGGDEFALFVESEAQAAFPELLGRQVVQALQQPVVVNGAVLSVSATVGIAIAPEHGRHAEQLIHAADLAMYLGKRSGKGRVQVVAEVPPAPILFPTT